MKNKLLILLLVLMSAFNAIADDEATELNCEVDVNCDKISNANRDIFNELKQSVSDYMNTTKWTNATFGTNDLLQTPDYPQFLGRCNRRHARRPADTVSKACLQQFLYHCNHQFQRH